MKCPEIVCGWGAPPKTPLGELTTLTQTASRLGRGTPPNSPSLDAFDRCSRTFVATGRKDGQLDTPNFRNMAAPWRTQDIPSAASMGALQSFAFCEQ